MWPLELARAYAGLVGTEALDSLDAFVFCQEAGGGDIVVEFPVNEGGTYDGDESNKEEDAGGKLADVGNEGWRRHTSARSAERGEECGRGRKRALNR